MTRRSLVAPLVAPLVMIGAALLAACAASSDGSSSGDAGRGGSGDDAGASTTGDGGVTSSGDAAAGDDAGDVSLDDPSLPVITNQSGAKNAHVLDLVRAALTGLGFQGAAAPNHGDRVYVGQRYLAWIDQTGFYGKMNGLWPLDGAPGAALDFVLKEPDGRPVNMFVPGEDGEGNFAGGYKGAEHVEFPNRTPEANDDPNCAKSDWCNQYGLNEAPPITNPAIPWWSACNPGSIGFDQEIDPVVVQSLPGGGIKLVYEGPLVKQADGDSNKDGDACHADYLFPDGVRRAVYLRVGYELFPDKDYVDRTMEIRNPAGNPSFAGDMSLIGGFVMTSWPNPYYVKRLNRFWRPEGHAVNLTWDGAQVALPAGAFTDLHGEPTPAKDVVLGWADQPLTLSGTGSFAHGRTATVANVGPSDNGDVGACLCTVHGAIEMGGGLIHANVSLPIAGGASTIEARRRITLPGANAVGTLTGHAYKLSDLGHAVGRAEADGWSAATGPDASGHMVFGPYATDWGGGAAEAVITMMVDNTTADNGVVATLELYDATDDVIFATRDIRRGDMHLPMTFQRVTLSGNLDGRGGHRMEVRIYWRDISYVKVGSVTVNTSDL